MIQLRDYQMKAEQGVFDAWRDGARNVLLVMPVGAGKTVTMADIIWHFIANTILKQMVGRNVCAIAHRQELVSQISLALARCGIRHRLIAPAPVIKFIVQLHMQEVGTSFYQPNAPVAVAGVDTLVRLPKQYESWLKTVGLWVQDEAHHVLQRNKWGKAAAMFPNACGLGVTATPLRADGAGLGRHADGVFDQMVLGPSLRWMIWQGYLTPYRLFAPPSDMKFDGIEPGASGDYSFKQLRDVAKKSHIVGDVVEHYAKLARGKLGITFAPDIETAGEITDNFNAAGIKAALVTGETPDHLRVSYMRQFRARELLQLVNVDLFGEGVDVPAVEVTSMARKTESFSLFVQQAGRALRPVYRAGADLSTQAGRLDAIATGGKPEAIIIDHAGNIMRHSVARDCPYSGDLIMDICHREWSLDRREKRSKSKKDDAIPVSSCPACTGTYPRILPACPYCGIKPTPRARSAPEFVDGDLFELDAMALAAMLGKRIDVDKPLGKYNQELHAAKVPMIGIPRMMRNMQDTQVAQRELRETIAQWAGWQRLWGRSDPESHRRFWFSFGTDVITAQSLEADAARELNERILAKMGEQ